MEDPIVPLFWYFSVPKLSITLITNLIVIQTNKGHGLEHVADKIFMELDLSSLLNVELVSCNWRQVMTDLKIWTKIFHHNGKQK